MLRCAPIRHARGVWSPYATTAPTRSSLSACRRLRKRSAPVDGPVRHGKTRCAACSELERLVHARALARLGDDLSLPISLTEFRSGGFDPQLSRWLRQ